MALPELWFVNNDMLVVLDGLQSSTATSAYIANSTGVKVSVWKALSTASTTDRLVNARQLTYVSSGSGKYRTAVQSTEATSIANGTQGMAIITVNHSGLNAEYRVPFRGAFRRTT